MSFGHQWGRGVWIRLIPAQLFLWWLHVASPSPAAAASCGRAQRAIVSYSHWCTWARALGIGNSQSCQCSLACLHTLQSFLTQSLLARQVLPQVIWKAEAICQGCFSLSIIISVQASEDFWPPYLYRNKLYSPRQHVLRVLVLHLEKSLLKNGWEVMQN